MGARRRRWLRRCPRQRPLRHRRPEGRAGLRRGPGALDRDKLAAIRDERVRLSLELQAAFGLRREEAIKFCAAYADCGDRIVLKASWCKGGRMRRVPVVTSAQRDLLDRVRAFVGGESLIPPDAKYIEQRGRFERETRRAGMPKSHRLRHGYGQRRYRNLTGFACPAAERGSVQRLW